MPLQNDIFWSFQISANFNYGPFGEVIRATGPMAKVNPFGWGGKIGDPETDLVYYGYRYYNRSTGRWLSRDPIEEKAGGPHLYKFVSNDPLDVSDPLGLQDFSQQFPIHESPWDSGSLVPVSVLDICSYLARVEKAPGAKSTF